jgi:hypothetical protein
MPVLFSKLLPFLLMPVAVVYLFAFGKSMRSSTTGIILGLGFLFFNLSASSAISIANGLQRSFATLLVIVLIYYLQSHQYIPATIVIVLSALIYPPMFVLAIMIWGIAVLAESWSTRTISFTHTGFSFLILSFCLGVLILSPLLFKSMGDGGAGELLQMVQPQAPAMSETTGKYLWSDPQYQKGGAAPLFIVFPLVGRGGIVDLGEDLINLLIFVLLGGLVLLVRGRKALNLPATVWYMLWATLILFVMAWLAIWVTGSTKLLYWPSRYTRVGLFLFFLMFVGFNLEYFLQEAPLMIRNRPRQLIWLIVGIEIFIIALAIAYPTEWAGSWL